MSSQKVLKASSQKSRLCPLNDPNIGIISENDHRVGLCLCRFCDCGEHRCSKNVNPNARSTFNTKYMIDQKPVERYSKELNNNSRTKPESLKSSSSAVSKSESVAYKSMMSPLKPEQKLYRPNTSKMDLVTTNQVEYQKRVPTPEVTRVSPASPFRSESNKITAYAADYPDWGPVRVSREKTWHPPVRSVDLSFIGSSSYKDKFQSPDPAQVDMYKTSYTTFSAFQSKFSLAPKDKCAGNTTYGEKMKNFNEPALNSRVVVRPAPMTPTPATNSHFLTTFKDSFKPTTPTLKDPRRLRYGLMEKRRNGSVNNKA